MPLCAEHGQVYGEGSQCPHPDHRKKQDKAPSQQPQRVSNKPKQ